MISSILEVPPDPLAMINSIFGHSPDRYPFERVVSLMTFGAWLRWPTDPDLVSTARLAAATSVYVRQKQEGHKIESPLTVDILADGLVNSRLASPFREAFVDSEDDIVEIVGFFMHCPENLNPSLLKARYFIEQGGFVPEDVPTKEWGRYKSGSSTLKSVWSEQAIAGPFLWAAFHSNNVEILEIVPDEPETITIAERYLDDAERLKNLFGVARFCQEKLFRLLDFSSSSRFKFVEFPTYILSVEPDIETFDEFQLAILKKYRAPQ